jgi:hypothetical protein
MKNKSKEDEGLKQGSSEHLGKQSSKVLKTTGLI